MSTAPAIPHLHGRATVAMSVEKAFAFFTESFGSWWPAEYHIGQADMADAVLEPRKGGRWYERGTDGSECDWGRVLAWEPPHRLVVTWQVNGQWQYDDDPSTPARSKSGSRPTDRSRPPSSSNTGTSTASLLGRRSTTPSARAAAGPPSWRRTPRPARLVSRTRTGRRGARPWR
jgi:uncharacterized protein YndB with AHSA1/START domain